MGEDIKQHIFTFLKVINLCRNEKKQEKTFGESKERDENSGFTMSTVAEKANTSLAISTTVGTYENRR